MNDIKRASELLSKAERLASRGLQTRRTGERGVEGARGKDWWKYFKTRKQHGDETSDDRREEEIALNIKSEDFKKLKPLYQGDAEEKEKSDVEEGTYGNIGSTSNVAPSTSTNLDVSESTGYEERPHISVEEVGSLPRRDAKDNDDDETKEKEDDIKEPKESKDTQKVGVPTANYNTFGITYAVKANTVWNKKTQRWEQKDG